MQNICLKFPNGYLGHKYGLIHFHFFVQYAKIAGINVELVKHDEHVFISEDQLIFSCTINDQQVIFDYADHSTRNWKSFYPDIPYFKFQSTLTSPKDLIPLGPPMVGVKRVGSKGATVREYNHMKYRYEYKPGTAVLCKQLPNGAAVERRNHVHQLLTENFSNVDTASNCNQLDFWRLHETCLAAVCVPGATNNMVDRGHMELIGLGVCTISPKLQTVFPNNQTLKPGKHYIQCQDDYSNLVEIIQGLQRDPSLAAKIGRNARKFYEKFYTPEKYWEWIARNIK